jgi:hypothetical protein
MPISFHVDRLGRRVVTRASGLVTFSELSEHLDAEERQRALDLTELFDARGATTDITRIKSSSWFAALRKPPAGPHWVPPPS